VSGSVNDDLINKRNIYIYLISTGLSVFLVWLIGSFFINERISLLIGCIIGGFVSAISLKIFPVITDE
jgi:hypothetical protein